MMRSLVAALLSIACTDAALAADRVSPTRAPTGARGDFSRRVALPGGREMHIECRGSGRPIVVLEAGTGDLGTLWSEPPGDGTPILPAVARFTRVCAYDRPGTYLVPHTLSRSDPVAMPRSAADIVRDLRALLRAARVPGPHVLVGHSFGGMVARLYATMHPADVAGLVSVDAQNEDFVAAYKRLLSPEQYMAAVLDPAPALADYPDVERLALEVSAAQTRQAQADTPLRMLSLVILSHSKDLPNPFGFPPDWPIAGLEQAFQASQDALAALVPDARHVVATTSGHYIHLDQPELVIDEIRWVVERVRVRRGR